MITNYNGAHFSEAQQYDALIALLSNSKKTRNYPVFSIENVLRNEWLLLFLLNQKKYIEVTRQKNSYGNIMYSLTKRWNNFIESLFFSRSGFIYSIVMLFVIFILPLLFTTGFNIIKKEISLLIDSELNINFTLFFILIWLIYIFHLMRKNRKKREKQFIKFKKKYNLN